MRFADAATVENIAWQMRLNEFERSANRDKIDQLAAGFPPYSPSEAEANGIEVNSNDLSLTRLAHDARAQLYQGHFKPGNAFTARTDMGPLHRRAERGNVVTKEINRFLKHSIEYYELQRSKFAQDVLHGKGIGVWNTKQMWCPDPTAIVDVLVPSNTLLTFKNLTFLAICREYTAEELYRLTHGPNVDKGWNMDAVMDAIKWAEKETRQLMGNTWQATYWAPEKVTERIVENSGLYASDMVQTISLIDFYFYDCESKESGWKRRLIFDAWGGYSSYQGAHSADRKTMPDKNIIGGRNQWVYNSGDRVYAEKLSEIIHFQFADLTPIAPFTYHGIRSLGHMIYSACHLQNRLRCSFAEAVFEQLMQYFKVNSRDDAERALKIQLVNRGFIDPSVSFVPANERWQPNAPLIEMGMAQYQRIIDDNASSYVQNQDFSRDRTEKTKYQVQAEVNAMMTLVSAALQQSYKYQVAEYQEIFRRFCIPNSRDPDVRSFRLRCLLRGVPEKMLVPEAWDLEPERVMGSGNKTLEMAIAQQLMEWRPAFGPEAQQKILRMATLAITDDAATAQDLVPDRKTVSDASHDAMLAFGSLMAGAEVQFRPDQNLIDITETLLGEMALKVSQLSQGGNTATASEVLGLQNVGTHVGKLIQQVGQDKASQERAKQYGQAIGKLMNEVKGFAQRLAEEMQAKNGDSGIDAETQAKIQALLITAKAKAQNVREAHSQRTAQRQAQFELEQQRKDHEHALEMQREVQRQQVEDTATDLRTAATIRRERAEAEVEKKKRESKSSPAE